MDHVTVTCTCISCNQTFSKSTYCNKKDGRRWKQWAKRTFLHCPVCFRERQRMQRKSDAAYVREKVQLPTLFGTPGQVAYANDLIDQTIGKKVADFLHFCRCLATWREDAKKRGKDGDGIGVLEQELITFRGWTGYQVIMTETNAAKVIERFAPKERR